MIEKISNINTQEIVSDIPKKIVFWLYSFFTSQFFYKFIFYAKVFSIILSIILLLAIILLFIASKPIEKLRKFGWRNLTPLPKTKYQIKWGKIEKRLAGRQEAEYKLAVIEADKVVDNILFLIGYKGNTLGEKLKKMNIAQLSSLNDIWEAHKLRNKIVHYPDERVTIDEAAKAVEKFKKAMEELDVL